MWSSVDLGHDLTSQNSSWLVKILDCWIASGGDSTMQIYRQLPRGGMQDLAGTVMHKFPNRNISKYDFNQGELSGKVWDTGYPEVPHPWELKKAFQTKFFSSYN